MQVLIVEDEILLAKRLQKLLLETEPSATVLAILQSVEETVDWLQHHPEPDLLLMDIELADGQSFDIFQQVTVRTPVIFTTAYDEYAIKAFKVNSIDYLLKPIKQEELKVALYKFKTSVASIPTQQGMEKLLVEIRKAQLLPDYRNRLLIKQGQRMISIDVADIAYVFSENGFSFLRTHQNQKYLTEYTLDELEESLSPKQFFRANRQYIISPSCVVAIHTWFNQKLKVEVKPATDENIVISREKANAFKVWMGE